jgi:serine/threonine protein kinase
LTEKVLITPSTPYSLLASIPGLRAVALSAYLTDDCFWSITVNLNHFRLLRVVGRGAFGKVRIVERKDTNLSFALKYIRKDEGTKTHAKAGEI